MASIQHIDGTSSISPMALRQSIEAPTDRRSRDLISKRTGHAMTLEMPSESNLRLSLGAVDMGEEARPSHDNCNRQHEGDGPDPTITLSSTDKVAGMTVAPFLARHIPEQYAPMGLGVVSTTTQKNPNTKYCYRHRPDSKCRRTADEPTMENLQRELETLSQADQQGISHVWSLFSAAPAKHRNLMLQGILTQCCFPQLSYLSTAVRDLIRIDFVAALPSEISFKILCYLDTTSLCKAAQVSQKWRILADDDVVWHKMCEQHIDRKCIKCGWGLPLLERKRLRDWKRQQQLRATGRGLNEWSPNLTPIPDERGVSEVMIKGTSLNGSLNGSLKRDAASFTSDVPVRSPEASKRQRLNPEDSYFERPKFRPWKDVYKDRFKVGTNWKYGRCSTKLFRGHTNGVMCLQFDDNILATGSYDSTIKLWNIETGECLRTLRGHTSGIRALQFDDMKLISGSLDRTLRVWNWRTGECISTYQGHSEGVIAVNFEGNILASGSVDKTVKIWNFEDKSTFCLRGHKDWVNAVRVDSASRTVFSASDDCTIRLWDLDTRQTIRIFEAHVGQVQQVILLPPEYEPEDGDAEQDDGASSTASTTDLHTPSLLSDAPYGDDWPSTRPFPPRYMVTGALDSTVRLWDVSTGRCLKTMFGHVEGVWAVAADTLRVVSGAEDRMVKVWDARTGKCEKTFSGHAGPVTCIGLSDSKMVTGSEDCDVRLYSFKIEPSEPVETDLVVACTPSQ
ncbi:E3 ubiquitin ligase complex SCF subunit sconB [Diplocarpon rosae]|nr:E3 ubiquitin ligase complex SCF subunit sconB [Diplocarpon rosae]